MDDLFSYSPLDMSADDFWTLVGAVFFLFGIKAAADDSPHFPSFLGLILALSSALFIFWIRFWR